MLAEAVAWSTLMQRTLYTISTFVALPPVADEQTIIAKLLCGCNPSLRSLVLCASFHLGVGDLGQSA